MELIAPIALVTVMDTPELINCKKLIIQHDELGLPWATYSLLAHSEKELCWVSANAVDDVLTISIVNAKNVNDTKSVMVKEEVFEETWSTIVRLLEESKNIKACLSMLACLRYLNN